MRKILIIDGNYFAQRVLGQLNQVSTGKVNNLETETEQNHFKFSLYSSLINLWKTFNNSNRIGLINQIVFASDFGSWRKEFEPFVPYWLSKEDQQTTPLKYKEQRISKKEESPINYDNFYKIYQEFVDNLKNLGVVTFKVYGFEGDDNLALLSKLFRSYKNTVGVVFATDGDLEQLVHSNFILFKNIRSKEAPNGELVLDLDTYSTAFERVHTLEELVCQNQLDTNFIEQLSKISIGDTEGVQKHSRTLNAGIRLSKPYKTLLVKSIAGDKKDNLFSPISWLSKTGSVRYGITEKIIQKAFDNLDKSFTETNCKWFLERPEYLNGLVMEVVKVCSSKTTDSIPVQTVINHVKFNLMMNDLVGFAPNTSERYKQCVEQFKEQFKSQLELIETGSFPIDQVMSFMGTLKGFSAENLYAQSLPDDLNEILEL